MYGKLVTAMQFMTDDADREDTLTKRWRATPGMMKAIDRGSVWEGWGVKVDRGVEMGEEERVGRTIMDEVVQREKSEEELDKERKLRELEEWEAEEGDMEMDEEW